MLAALVVTVPPNLFPELGRVMLFPLEAVSFVSGIATSPYYHAFITNPTTNAMTDLGTLDGTSSSGYGINARGQVTGESLTRSGTSRAFLYWNGRMVDLNAEIGSAATLYTLTSAQGINDNGQIVANGTVNATGEDIAFLLTPTAISTSTSLTPPTRFSTYGSSVTLAALVTPSSGPAPTGNVRFFAGAVNLGNVSINDAGQALLTTSALPMGAQSFTATCSGSSTNLGDRPCKGKDLVPGRGDDTCSHRSQ